MSEQPKNTPVVETEQDFTEVVKVRREKLNTLVQNGKNPYEITKFDIDSNSKKVVDEFDDNMPEGEVKMVKIAGRIVSRRIMGKALIGHKKGDVVDVVVPAGAVQFEILEISF